MLQADNLEELGRVFLVSSGTRIGRMGMSRIIGNMKRNSMKTTYFFSSVSVEPRFYDMARGQQNHIVKWVSL